MTRSSRSSPPANLEEYVEVFAREKEYAQDMATFSSDVALTARIELARAKQVLVEARRLSDIIATAIATTSDNNSNDQSIVEYHTQVNWGYVDHVAHYKERVGFQPPSVTIATSSYFSLSTPMFELHIMWLGGDGDETKKPIFHFRIN
jgi:hypothetical protein